MAADGPKGAGVKSKPGLGEIVKVKKKVAATLFIIDPGRRTGPVVDTRAHQPDMVTVELLAPYGEPYIIAMYLKEIKHVR